MKTEDNTHELLILYRSDIKPFSLPGGATLVEDVTLSNFYDLNGIRKASLVIYMHSPNTWKILKCRFKRPKNIIW